MKKIVISLFILLYYSVMLSAQDTTFFNSSWAKIEGRSGASYFRIVQQEGNKWLIKDYYISGNPQMVGYYTDLEKQTKDGLFTFYRENGKPKSSQIYKNGEEYMIQRWDEQQKETLKNGTGQYKYFHDQVGADVIMIYKDSLFQYSFFVDPQTKQTIYLGIKKEDSAVPDGGFEVFYQELAKNLVYPTAARKLGVEGTVYVRFIVRKDGTLDNLKILKDLGSGCGDEVIRYLKSVEKWIPGKVNGKNVDMMITIPVRFKLT